MKICILSLILFPSIAFSIGSDVPSKGSFDMSQPTNLPSQSDKEAKPEKTAAPTPANNNTQTDALPSGQMGAESSKALKTIEKESAEEPPTKTNPGPSEGIEEPPSGDQSKSAPSLPSNEKSAAGKEDEKPTDAYIRGY